MQGKFKISNIYNLFVFPAEDDDGYRSASPSSQTTQSAACVLLWTDFIFWQRFFTFNLENLDDSIRLIWVKDISKICYDYCGLLKACRENRSNLEDNLGGA